MSGHLGINRYGSKNSCIDKAVNMVRFFHNLTVLANTARLLKSSKKIKVSSNLSKVRVSTIVRDLQRVDSI